MKILSIWRAMTGAERVVAVAAALALASCVAFAGPSRCSSAPATSPIPTPRSTPQKGPARRRSRAAGQTVDWPRFGYDPGAASSSTPSSVRPPFRKVWKYKGDELIEFPPIVVDDRLYFIDNDGLYVCLDARRARSIWRKQLADAERLLAGLLRRRPLHASASSPARRSPSAPATARCSGARSSAPAPSPRRWSSAAACTSATRPATSTRSTSRTARRDLDDDRRTARSRPRPRSSDGHPLLRRLRRLHERRPGHPTARSSGRRQDLGVGSAARGGSTRPPRSPSAASTRATSTPRSIPSTQKTGEIAWTHSAGGYVYSGVAAAETKGTKPAVYVGSHDRNVYALEAEDGEVIWQEAAGGQISGPATVIGDVVYVSTFSGNATIGLDLGTGRRVFSFDDGEYGPVVSDNEKLYLTGGVTVTAFEPVDLGDDKYKTKKGQKGIVPPPQQRKARKQARERAQHRAQGQPGEGQQPAGQQAQPANGGEGRGR